MTKSKTTPRKRPLKERKRIGEIVHELARLSRDGWRHARPEDYQPLEHELAQLWRKS